MVSSLNPSQHKALVHQKGPLLVLAGAGSGKTRVITEKIAHLYRNQKIALETIYALTFTNKAANEMRVRLARLIGRPLADKVHITTFHVLGLSIIRKELKALALKPQFTLLDEADCLSLIQSLSPKAKSLSKPEAYAIKNQISRWKCANLLPADVRSDQDVRALQYYSLYQSQLFAYSAMDFDDLIMIPTRLLRENAMVLDRWRAKVAYLMVDEYQDTNHSQYELVCQLTRHNRQFTFVGDDDQSIYSWRGARPENIILLKADFPELEVIMLEENYRSTNTILRAANQLISHNPHAYEKKLWSIRGEGDKIKVVDADDDEAEANQVVYDIQAHRFKSQCPYSAFAILYRSNYQSAIFEKALRLHDIPYKITGGPSFFARMEIKDILAYCRLIINPEDDNAFLRIINVPRRGIGTTLLAKVGEYAKRRQISLFKAISEFGLLQSLPQTAVKSLENFVALMNALRQKQHHVSPAIVCREILNQTHYYHWLESVSDTKEVADKRIENIESLIGWFGSSETGGGAPKRSFSDVILTLTLCEKDRQEEDKPANVVQLMTVHSAKGLEYDNVYLVGFEEGILPHAASIETQNIEEERRLAYVALTRAKKRLMISYAHARKRHGKLCRACVSQFLAELDPSCLLIKAEQTVDQAAVKQNNQVHLSRLKALVNRI